MSWFKTASSRFSAANSAAKAARAAADAASAKNPTQAAEAAARAAEAVAEASHFDLNIDDTNNNIKHTAIIRDSERYRSDAHRIWIFKVANNSGIAISLEIKNERDGMMVYSDYWHYKHQEEDKANKTFQSLVKISENLRTNIESKNTPTSLICPLIRAQTRNIDLPYREKTSLGFFDDGLIENTESDWRQTIYGNRYPHENSETIGQNWNKDEQGRKISSDHKNSRSRTYRYNYE